MIIKGIVEEYINRDNIKIRVPQLHGIKGDSYSVKTIDLPNAVMCTLPNCEIKLASGDIVWVEFENLEWGKPVIVGFLDIKSNSKIMLNITELDVEDKMQLPANTSIGDVSADSIQCLAGLTVNLQDYINNTSPVAIIDLSMYNKGDEIPVSVINSIPDSAMLFAKRVDEFHNEMYFTLIEKSQNDGLYDVDLSMMENVPRFDYIFSNGIDNISIICGKVV